jgi:hypothetical protein
MNYRVKNLFDGCKQKAPPGYRKRFYQLNPQVSGYFQIDFNAICFRPIPFVLI